MGEFFKGWRRRFGLLTLVMACVCMVLWVRANSTTIDVFSFPTGSRSWQLLISDRAGMNWLRLNDSKGVDLRSPFYDSEPVSLGILASYDINWGWKWCGFQIGNGNDAKSGWRERFLKNGAFRTSVFEGQISSIVLFPHWALMLPLTLLSAYLLLSKPRKSTQKKNDEPISEKVA